MTDGTGETDTTATGRRDARHRAGRLLRRGVVSIHVLQIPLLFGLMLALLVLTASFFYALAEAVISLDFLHRDRAILLVLDLLDMVFIANLVVMVMVSGYNAYFSAITRGLRRDRLFSYSDEFQPVKSRIAATLVIITGIHLVHEVLSGEQTDPAQLLILGVTHLILLVSAAVFFYVGRFERRDPPAPHDAAPSGLDERGGSRG
ncbi:YqhA family protein [Roseovarius sp. D22-M7]|uniref:YqhA family protein n=1 Tax=Roseovarius sp. D22-M7 TaxID=3127116 RepID=UPI00300FED8B